MNFFDCFMYNNEELLLDIRLSILSKYIKKFILVESLVDHQGNAKKNSFQIENFKKYKDKIIHLNSEREIDQLLFDINEQIKVLEKLDAKHQIEKMPLFFN